MRILIWGTGGRAERWINTHTEIFEEVEVLAFVDSFRIGNFMNKNIIHPDEMVQYQFDYIVIASTYYKEIYTELIQKYHIEKIKILSLGKLYQLWFRNRNQFVEEISDLQERKNYFGAIIMDPRLIDYSNEWISYDYIKNEYTSFMENKPWTSKEKVKKIWIYWEQGIENAPPLVKRCVSSVKKWNSDINLEIVSMENMNQYIEIPQDILEMHESGIIGYAHFADLVRLELLYKYGGLWMDATVFCTDHLPNYIFEDSFFMFQFPDLPASPTPRAISNWLIYSDKNHSIVEQARNLMYLYWRKEKKAVNYYILHFPFYFSFAD